MHRQRQPKINRRACEHRKHGTCFLCILPRLQGLAAQLKGGKHEGAAGNEAQSSPSSWSLAPDFTLPCLSVCCCWCWRSGSHSDRPLLYPGTCARTSSSPADKRHFCSAPTFCDPSTCGFSSLSQNDTRNHCYSHGTEKHFQKQPTLAQPYWTK